MNCNYYDQLKQVLRLKQLQKRFSYTGNVLLNTGSVQNQLGRYPFEFRTVIYRQSFLSIYRYFNPADGINNSVRFVESEQLHQFGGE